MPRAKPINSRKKAALSFIVEANDRGRYVAGVLRRSPTNVHGEKQPLTQEDIKRMLNAIERAHRSLDNASAYIESMYPLGLKEQ